MLRKSHTRYTSLRRPVSLECSSAEYSMVCRLIHPSVLTHPVCSIYYLGVVIVLFFQCMGVLLGSAYCERKGVRWVLLAYATVSFSFVTIFTAINLHIQSISYIDNREFPGGEVQPPGPLGYQLLIYSKPISIVANLMFLLCNWLADGLLVSSVSSPVF